MEFVNLLAERRKDCDILWVSRPMTPLLPHKLPESDKYTRRQIIYAVLNSSDVQNVIDALAHARNVERHVVVAEALDMLKEMASKDHLPTVRWLAILITKVMKRILMGIYLNESSVHALKNRMQVAQVQYVYAPSHRSYLDFVLLSYILFSYDMALPNIASGMDFYRMKIVGELLRKSGAFYMRRSFSNDQLYKEIFRAYVKTIVSHSDRAIEFFIEGTRSRSQKSLSPKYGLLAMILDVLFHSEVPDILFIPMSINYERPLEELLFTYELLGVPKPAESTRGLLKSLSILREPYGHGDMYFNVATPISAKQFLHYEIQKQSALSPDAKLPLTVVKRLAHSIIDSHKTNTILTPFNLIAVLFNQHVLMRPNQPFLLDELAEQFRWLQSVMASTFGALTSSNISIKSRNCRTEREDILESLKIHKDLIFVDSTGRIRIKDRHRIIENVDNKNVKGHNFSNETMRVAIPAINMSIYTNPTLAYFAKPALAAISINKDTHTSQDCARSKYLFLRQLLAIEFAFSTESTDEELENEWQNLLSMLNAEKCVETLNDNLVVGQNTALFSLLCNLILPYIEALNVICYVLATWNVEINGETSSKKIVTECQRQAEEQLYTRSALSKHPYALSLDLYNSSLASLLHLGALQLKEGIYTINESLREIQSTLETTSQHFPPGSYLDVLPNLMTDDTPDILAKLEAS